MVDDDTATSAAEAFATYLASSAVDSRVLFLATLAPAAVFAMVAPDPLAIDAFVEALPRVAPPHVLVLAQGSDEPLAERVQRVIGHQDLAHASLQALGELQRAHPNGAALRTSFLDFARTVAGEHASTSRGKRALKLVRDVVDLPMGRAAPLELLRAVVVAAGAIAAVALLVFLVACRDPNDTAPVDDTDAATDRRR